LKKIYQFSMKNSLKITEKDLKINSELGILIIRRIKFLPLRCAGA